MSDAHTPCTLPFGNATKHQTKARSETEHREREKHNNCIHAFLIVPFLPGFFFPLFHF